MNKKVINIDYTEYSSSEEMDVVDRELINRAIEAAKSAYAPYSGFNVGASVLLDNGEIIAASNQENAAYPSGLCAERVALFYANSKFPGVGIKKIAVTAMHDGSVCTEPTYPCGACRQVMAESESRSGEPLSVIIYSMNRIHKIDGVKSLLPFMFDNLPLKK